MIDAYIGRMPKLIAQWIMKSAQLYFDDTVLKWLPANEKSIREKYIF